MIFKSKFIKIPDPSKFLTFKFCARNLSHTKYLELLGFWKCVKNREWFFVAVFSELELLSKSVPLLEKKSLMIFSLLAWTAQWYQDYRILDYHFVSGIKATEDFLNYNIPQVTQKYASLRTEVFKEEHLKSFPFLGLIPNSWVKSSFIRHDLFLIEIAKYLNLEWKLPNEEVADFASNLGTYHFLHSQWQIFASKFASFSLFNSKNKTDLLLYKGKVFDKMTAFLRHHYLYKFNDLVKLVNKFLPH